MSSPKTLTKGEDLPGIDTASWNAFCQLYSQFQAMLGRGASAGVSSASSRNSLELKNNTGADITCEFPILKIGDPVITFTDEDEAIRESPQFKGETPDGSTDIADIAIVLGPLADGETAPAIFQGAAHCEVDVSDEDHTSAVPIDGDNTKLASAASGGVKIRWKESGTGTKKAVVILGGGAGGGGGPGVSIKIVLIDRDIPGIDEADPARTLVEDDIVATLTEEEQTAVDEDELLIVFQDPIPDDDTADEPNYDDNHVDSLNLFRYKRQQVSLKYFQTDPLSHAGTCESDEAADSVTLTLDETTEPSTVDDYYVGGTIEIVSGTGSGQTRTITAYDATTRVVTVSEAWDTGDEPDNTSQYEITLSLERCLSYTVLDDSESDPPRKIVRYATTTVVTDDGTPFEVGEYDREDYADYPENEEFPPDGTGTYQEMPDGYFNRRYRGVAINTVLIMATCRELPPPPLVEVE